VTATAKFILTFSDKSDTKQTYDSTVPDNCFAASQTQTTQWSLLQSVFTHNL